MIGGVLADVWDDVEAEMFRAKKLHPAYPEDDLRRTCLVVEEAGEALKEAIDLTRPGARPDFFRPRLYAELVQVAAKAVHQLQVMKQEEIDGTQAGKQKV